MKNKKMITVLAAVILAAVFIMGCAERTGEKKEVSTLTVFAAASLTDAMGELQEIYEREHPDTRLEFSFGGSGALRTQIEEGAPADVFISAATDHMDALEKGGFVKEGTRSDLLENETVLIVPKDSVKAITSFDDLAKDEVDLIGVGESESVPAGKYAMEIFNNTGIYDAIKDKLNFGQDVRTVLAWTEEGAVDCGVVYATDAYTSDRVTIATKAPKGSVSRVIYPLCIIKESKNISAAEGFTGFLESEEAAAVFEKYGFRMVRK